MIYRCGMCHQDNPILHRNFAVSIIFKENPTWNYFRLRYVSTRTSLLDRHKLVEIN